MEKNLPEDPDQDLLIREEPYIGNMVFSRKACGPDFLDAFVDGRIQLQFLDFGHYYN